MKTSKIFYLVSVMFLIVLVGIFGYSYIEDYSLIDSLYMTIITLTTTGFQEVRPLSIEGKIFTIALLVTGMGVFAYSITAIMSGIMTMNFYERRKKKMQKQIDNLFNHSIICGFGRMGTLICEILQNAGHKFVVIVKGHNQLDLLSEKKYLFINKDATEDEALLLAGIKRAKNIITVIDDDHDALYITLAAKSLNKKINIISRANQESADKKLKLAGANKVFLPLVVSGQKVASMILNPAVEETLNITGSQGTSENLQMSDFPIGPKSPILGKYLSDCGFERKEILIIGVRKADGDFIFAPSGTYQFAEGDHLIALGKKENQDIIQKDRLI